MPSHHAILLAGAAALVFAGSAPAAAQPVAAGQPWHTTTVALPDGATAEIHYVGEVPPQVTVAMAQPHDWRRHGGREAAAERAWAEADAAYGGIPRARRIIRPRAAPVAPQAALPQFVVPMDAPKGATYFHTLITTGPDGRVCAQRTEWISRGRGKEPDVRRSDAGAGCAGAGAPPAPLVAPPSPASVPTSAPPTFPPPPAPPHKPVAIDPDAM